jgi:hypothetical protein
VSIAGHITTGVASKLSRDQRLGQERVILIGLSSKETIMNETKESHRIADLAVSRGIKAS